MLPALPSQTASADNTLAMAQSQPVISQARAEVAAHQTPVKFERSHMHWHTIEDYMNSQVNVPDRATLVRYVEDLLYYIRSQQHNAEHTYSYEPQHLVTNPYPEQPYDYPPAHKTYQPARKQYRPRPDMHPRGRRHSEPGYGLSVPTRARADSNYGLNPPGEFTMSLGFTSSSAVSPDGGDI